uniref:Na+/H+ antiporter subunit C n=1 Tax=Litorilinea aerophila TaxID=1204385 RepID=A0A540VMZ8_9CHLR
MGLLVALLVGLLFATGTYLLLRRDPIKLILGLSLLSYAVNLLLFGTSGMARGIPPIVADKESFTGDISRFVDPLPQALILTAIVISFGVTAFVVVLVNRRNSLADAETAEEGGVEGEERLAASTMGDPFASDGHYLSDLETEADDYEWLEYSLVEEYRRRTGSEESAEGEPPAPEREAQQRKEVDGR